MAERRKRAGHLVSKHRYLALQFQAFLKDDCWLRLARHANAMADRLAAGLTAAGRSPAWPVEANLVFADGKVILVDEDGTLGLLTVAPEKVTVLAKATVTSATAWTAPSLVGTTLYLRDRANIMAFDLGRKP